MNRQQQQPTMLFWGYGYVARHLARRLEGQGFRLIASTRHEQPAVAEGFPVPKWVPFEAAASALPHLGVTHMLHSIPPSQGCDPVWELHQQHGLQRLCPDLQWFAYLSSTGVYGDLRGEWADEATAPGPRTPRQTQRAKAEAEWADSQLPAHIFRLAGIYGPGRNALEDLLAGKARYIVKPRHYFSRIHVEDIAQALCLSIQHPTPASCYNLADDRPAPSHELMEFCAELTRRALPEAMDWRDERLSPMLREFYSQSRRVKNDLVKKNLGWLPEYPHYGMGLARIWEKLTETTV
jgi:nucleoside-diphosphate-sugar epimerase